jgi:hypothetical protein
MTANASSNPSTRTLPLDEAQIHATHFRRSEQGMLTLNCVSETFRSMRHTLQDAAPSGQTIPHTESRGFRPQPKDL